MEFKRLLSPASVLASTLVLASCGGGGGGSSGDVRPSDPLPSVVVTGPDKFLLFPNPQVQADGTMQTNSSAYTTAYYQAIDPNNERDTLTKFKAKNGFDSGTGTQVTVVFGDQRDLGYGRRMTARQNVDGTLAFFVENYLVTAGAGYTYSPFNLDAAVVRDSRWFLGVNAIEFSPGPGGGASFPKFYNYNSRTDVRENAVDLDGRGAKAMPGPCITCHGGRGDALTPPDATGKRLFNLNRNSVSQARGDVLAQLHPFEADAFQFSAAAGFTRADQEAAIKTINKMILCSYPLPAPSTFPEDACRRPASGNEWQGTAADLVKSFYGGNGLPNATFSDTYVPPSWVAAGQTTLYQSVIATSCRTCHIMRGTGAQSDLDFMTYEKFRAFSDRTKAHILDRGNMPLAKIVSDAFYGSTRPELMATFLQGQGHVSRDSSGVALKPGRPIADPGPSRVVRPGATTLSAANSLYAAAYAWSIISGPAGATLSSATGVSTTFNASANGTYVVQLVASNGTVQSNPVQISIAVDSALPYAPSSLRFANIKTLLQDQAICTNCHSPTGNLPRPPVFYTNDDRNGDGVIGDATDTKWMYEEVRGRVNFTEIAASALLRKPSGNHHSGGLQLGFDASQPPGSPARANYDLVLNWILAGAPE